MTAALLAFALFVSDPCVPPSPFRMPDAPPAVVVAKANPRRWFADRALVVA